MHLATQRGNSVSYVGRALFVLGYARDAQRRTPPTGGGGSPRTPLPRKKIPTDLRSLARGHTALCVKVLAGIVSQETVPPAARVAAAGILLDRGWGKAPQPHAGEDGKDIRVTIRKMFEGGDKD